MGDYIGTKLLTAEFAEEVAEDAEKGMECSGIGNIFFATFAEFYSAILAVKSFFASAKLLTAEFAEEVAEDAKKDKECSGIGNIFFATFAEFYSAILAVKSFCIPPQ